MAASLNIGDRPLPPSLGATPRHVLVQPDQQRTPLLQRPVVGFPVRRAVAGGLGPSHARSLTTWIRRWNPDRTRLLQQRRLDLKTIRSFSAADHLHQRLPSVTISISDIARAQAYA